MGRPLKLDPVNTLQLYKKLGTVKAVQQALARQGTKVACSSVWRAIQKTEKGALLMARNGRCPAQSSAHLKKLGLGE